MAAVGIPADSTVAAETSSSKWIALTGVLFALLLGLSVAMTLGEPDVKNATKLQDWAVKHTGALGGAGFVTMLAVIVGLIFLTWLHSNLGRDRGWLATLFAVGVVTFAVSGGVGAGVDASFGSDAKHLSTGSLQLLASLSQNLNYPMTCAGLVLMYLAAGFLIRRTRLLPGWLAWASWVLAVLAASFFLGFVALFGTALWMIVVSIYLAVRPLAHS
jgi:hypothetical protein